MFNGFVLGEANNRTEFSCEGGWLSICQFDIDPSPCIMLNHGEVQQLAEAMPFLLEIINKQFDEDDHGARARNARS